MFRQTTRSRLARQRSPAACVCEAPREETVTWNLRAVGRSRQSFTGLPGLDRASQALSPSLLIDSHPVRQRHTGNRQTPIFRISRVCFGQHPIDSPINQPDAHGLTAVGVGNRQWSMQPQQAQRQDEKGGGWPAAGERCLSWKLERSCFSATLRVADRCRAPLVSGVG
ncbi:hypothetical protein CPLU01_12303 [Colletotrichum plurivorum]|uniref:Uncharacterized protein n=1 Tax=Colletotrichum plurivorum TaxID=2175906 RepID=A0A8H6K040_9PEZI|nr:hypothetical protein CPLU01_12303 [Colletotrichum plurivorum]